MDEKDIAAKVAQNIPKPEPTTQPVENDSDSEKGYVQKLDDSQFNMYLRDYFNVQGINQYDENTKSMINVIQRWAYDTAQTDDHVRALQAIQSLESEIGSFYRKDRLERLSRFIKLKEQSKILNMQMDVVKGGV